MVSFGGDTDWIRVAFLTLAPLLGAAAASTLFAIATSCKRSKQYA